MPGPDLLIDESTTADLGVTDLVVAGSPVDPGYGGPDPAGTDRRGAIHRAMQVVVLAAPVAFLAAMAWTHRSMFFDGYIYLHVVQNILAGHGPVFNAGQRVEAFTSPMWTFVLSVAGLVTPFSLTTLAVDLGIALTVSGLGLVVVSSTRLVRRVSPDAFLLPLGAVAFVAVSPIWSLATLGLETGLTFFWLGCCFALLVRWSGPAGGDVRWYGLMVLGLGPLVRPELALDTVVFLLVLLVVDRGSRGWRGRIALVAWALALPLAYEVFRMGYYGMLVANTAVAKEASLPRAGQGIVYLKDFVTPYWLFVPAMALVIGAFLPLTAALRVRSGALRSRCALFALPAAAALNAGYITVMGGDYVHARLLVAPFFALCAPIAAVPLTRKYAISLLVVPWALVCAFSLRSVDGSPWNTGAIIMVTGHGQTGPDGMNWASPGRRAGWLTPSGLYLQEEQTAAPVRIDQPPAPGLHTPTVATYWIGAGPYGIGSGVRILDLLGLADPLDAHFQLDHRGVLPGHEKPMPTPWIAALLTADGASPAPIATLQQQRPGSYTPMIPDVGGHALAVETAWARAALSCPAIHALEYGTSGPLTIGAVLSDITHSVSHTTERIPPDPETAYHRFCGPGTPDSVRRITG